MLAWVLLSFSAVHPLAAATTIGESSAAEEYPDGAGHDGDPISDPSSLHDAERATANDTKEARPANSLAGGVDGEVTDRAGTSLSAVRIVLRQGDNLLRARTDDEGRFHFSGIRPGSWVLVVEGEGFAAARHDPVQVRLGRMTRVRVRLAELVEETIIVTSEPPWAPPRAETSRTLLSSSELVEIPVGLDPFSALEGVPGVEVDQLRRTSGSTVVGAGSSAEASVFRVDGVTVPRPTYSTTAASAGRMEVLSGGADASVPGPGVVVLLTSPQRSPQRRAEAAASHVNPSWQTLGSGPASQPGAGNGEVEGIPGLPGAVDGTDSGSEDEAFPAGGSRLERSTLWSLDLSSSFLGERLWIWGGAQERAVEEQRPEGTRPRSELLDTATKIQAGAWKGASIVASLHRNEWRRTGDGAGPDRAPETLRTAFEPSRWLALEVSQLIRSDFRLGWSLLGSSDAARVESFERDPGLFPGTAIVQGEDGVWRGGFAEIGRQRDSRGWRLHAEGFRSGRFLGHDIRSALESRTVDTAEEERWGDGDYLFLAGENFGSPFDLLRARRSGDLRLERTTTSLWAQNHMTLKGHGGRGGDWSFDLGIRFDAQDGRTLAGRAEANILVPELLPEVEYEGGDLVSWFDLSPRLAVAWSMGEARRTTVRASLGRFVSPLGTDVVGRVSPVGGAEVVLGLLASGPLGLDSDGLEGFDEAWDRRMVVIDRIGVDPYVPGSVTHPNANSSDLRSELTDEIRLALEHHLGRATALSLELVSRSVSEVHEARRFVRDATGASRLATASDYQLETVLQGFFPDGSPYSAPVYGLRDGLELTGGALLVNGDRRQKYEAVTVGLERRMSRGFQIRGHATLADWRWQVGRDFAQYDDPTDAAPGDSALGSADDDGGAVLQPGAGPGRYVHGRWSFDLAANWQIAQRQAWGFDAALHLHGREGYPIAYYLPVVTDDRIRQVQAGSYDTYRLEDVLTVNLRLAKELELSGLRAVLSLDTFNLLDDASVFERDPRLGTPQAGLIRETLSPRVVQVGFRLSWR